MMILTFGLFIQVSDSGLHGHPLVQVSSVFLFCIIVYTGETQFEVQGLW